MQRDIKISLGNNKYIYGTLRGTLDKSLIIFVHGFLEHKDEHLFFNGSKFFEKNGFFSFRFNLYHWKKNARKLEETTLSLSADDLDRVVKYFRKKGVKKIFVIGHSFGGLVILLSPKKDFRGIIFWDASRNARIEPVKYIKELDKYYDGRGNSFGYTLSNAMIKENKKIRPFDLIKNINVPIKIIVAGKGVLVKAGKKYYTLANNPKSFSVISDATHNFDEDKKEEELFEESLKWIKNL